jgi:hypothetical protein
MENHDEFVVLNLSTLCRVMDRIDEVLDNMPDLSSAALMRWIDGDTPPAEAPWEAREAVAFVQGVCAAFAMNAHELFNQLDGDQPTHAITT